MASRLLRRSGVAMGMIADHLGWKPDWVCQVGVGMFYEEINVFVEEWKLPQESIIGFEPNPVTFKRLTGNYPGLLVNMAVADYPGKRILSTNPGHKDGSTLKGLDGEVHQVGVEATTLDETFGPCEDLGNCLLWLDCEGSELDVLRGAKDFLGHVNAVNVEMTSRPNGTGWADPVRVHDQLSESGFWQQWIHTQRSSAGQYDAIYVREGLFRPEYCCNVHEQKRWRNRCEGK